MSAQLNIRGNIIEMEEQITYNFQVGDIADFSAIKSNYTSSFKIPKTQDVVRLFEGLGIPSDMSRLPYTITDVQCLDDYTIVYEGSLIILSAEKLYYNATVVSGAKVFADSISGLTLYDVVVDEITNKTPDNVLDKLRDNSSAPTKYMFANYGGEREISGRNGAIDIDLFAESVSVSFLLDSIFNLSGFTYSIPSAIDLTNEYLAMPIPPFIEYAEVFERVVWANKNTQSSGSIAAGQPITGYQSWDSVAVENIYFNQSGVWNFVCAYPDEYVIIFSEVLAQATQAAEDNWFPMGVIINVNGDMVGRFSATIQPTDSDEIYRTIVALEVGDIVEVLITRPIGMSEGIGVRYEVNSVDLGIYNIRSDSEALRDSLDFTLTDFIKEFCYRYSLIPMHDANHITFVGFPDIMEAWEVVDWTDKFIERPEESYTLDYGYNNWLKHSYVDESDTQYNLNIPSFNANAEANHDIVVSKIFAPNRNGVFGIYDSNLQGDGTFTTKTNDRFYWIKRVRRFATEEIRVASRTVPGYIVSVGGTFNYAEYTAAFSESDRWKSLERIIQGLRVHNLTLNITTVDASQLDITKIYYFDQEQSYYLLNRLTYTKNQEARGEMVRIPCAWGWVGINPYCTLDNNGFNTGLGGYYDIENISTGEIRPNVPSDPNYIAPENKSECDAPALVSQLASITNGAPYTLSIYGNGQRYRVRIIKIVDESQTQIGDVYEGTDITHTYNWANELFFGTKDIEYYGGRANVTRIEFNGSSVSTLNLSGFSGLINLSIGFASTLAIDSAINHLDGTAKTDGYLSYGGTPSAAALESYNSLLFRGWTIDGNAPS